MVDKMTVHWLYSDVVPVVDDNLSMISELQNVRQLLINIVCNLSCPHYSWLIVIALAAEFLLVVASPFG